MSATAQAHPEDSVLRRLAGNDDESAALALLVHLCRASPQLRHWLWRDFAKNPRSRSRLAKLIKTAAPPAGLRFIDLTDDGAAFSKERRRLRARFPAGLYGGLTWTELMTLIRKHEAGTLDLGTFLLVQLWQEVGEGSPLLAWAGLKFLPGLLASDRWRLLENLKKAQSLVSRCKTAGNPQTIFGFSDWWKLQLFLYMLRHPKPAYRTREFRSYLAAQRIDVSPKDLRRFCARHGIRRDMRAGRPQTRVTAQVAAR